MKGKSSYRWCAGILLYMLLVIGVSQLPATHPNKAPQPYNWPNDSSNPLVGNWQGSWGGEIAAIMKRNVDMRLVIYPAKEKNKISTTAFFSLAPHPNLQRAPSQMQITVTIDDQNSSLTFLDGAGNTYNFHESKAGLHGSYTSTSGSKASITLYQTSKEKNKTVGDTGNTQVSFGPLKLNDFSLYMIYLVFWDSALQGAMYFFCCAVGFAIFYRLFKTRFERRKIQQRRPTWTQYKYEIGYSITAMLIFGLGGCILYYGIYTEHLRFLTSVNTYGWPYYFLSIALIFVLHDTYFYWGHRAMHIRSLYPYFHKGHHRSPNPTPWAAWAFPPLEGLIQAAFVPIVVLILPMHFSVLIIFFIGNLIRSIIGHCGYEIYPKATVTNKWLSWIATVTHHDMHHQYFNYNYAIYFTWWDKIMKTEHPEYTTRVKEILEKK